MAKAKEKAVNRKVISETGLNLREAPNKDAKILSILPFGSVIEIDEDSEAPEGWAAVKGGYVMEAFIK